MDPSFSHLHTLLKKRLDVIADHEWRDRNPDGHLDALREVSQALADEQARLRGQLPARLNHFLSQASYSKALEYLDSGADG